MPTIQNTSLSVVGHERKGGRQTRVMRRWVNWVTDLLTKKTKPFSTTLFPWCSFQFSSEKQINGGREEGLPQLLLLKSPSFFSDYEYRFSPKFQLLKAWESPHPTSLFLAAHAHSVKAVISSSSSSITSDILRHLPSLQLVAATTIGLDQIDLQECRRRGISVSNAGKVLVEDCADMAVGLLIDVLRKISAGDRFVRSGHWSIREDFPLGSRVSLWSLFSCGQYANWIKANASFRLGKSGMCSNIVFGRENDRYFLGFNIVLKSRRACDSKIIEQGRSERMRTKSEIRFLFIDSFAMGIVKRRECF